MKTPRVLSQLRVAPRLATRSRSAWTPAVIGDATEHVAASPEVTAAASGGAATARGAAESGPADAAVRAAVLETLEDFDTFGGGSHELVAWELGMTPDDIAAIWQDLIRDGLIEAAGTDPLYTEAMFRLTAAGLAQVQRTRASRESA